MKRARESKLISSDATDKREIGLSISNGITRRRSSLRLLGQEVLVDKNIKARLTFGQRSAEQLFPYVVWHATLLGRQHKIFGCG